MKGLLIDLDKDPALSEPLYFMHNGQEYPVHEVTEDHLDEIDAFEERANAEGLPAKTKVNKLLELLTGQPPELFAGMPLRKKRALIQAVREAITNPLKRPEAKPNE